MSTLSSIESAIENHFSDGGNIGIGQSITNIDIGKILEIVNAIVAAAPAIESGIASATPFVEAISEMIANGGKPTDAQWLALKASLDANSATLANAEAEAQAELTPAVQPAQSADAGVGIVTTHSETNTGSGVEIDPTTSEDAQ